MGKHFTNFNEAVQKGRIVPYDYFGVYHDVTFADVKKLSALAEKIC